jgi:hypothetical protein
VATACQLAAQLLNHSGASVARLLLFVANDRFLLMADEIF